MLAQGERVLDRPGSRICVVGTSGSGKTFVAQALAARLGLTYICNDAIIWRADWQSASQDDVMMEIDRATRAAGWSFDGNLVLRGGKEEDKIALDRCDTLVWLDLPRWQVHGQVVARTLRRVLTRERLWYDNVERWSTTFSADSIVWWSIKTFSGRRREYGVIFESPDFADKARIHLKSRAEVRWWLSCLASGSIV
jgi:adenylate kinase family enzyme